MSAMNVGCDFLIEIWALHETPVGPTLKSGNVRFCGAIDGKPDIGQAAS
jgi:hypothetical protein